MEKRPLKSAIEIFFVTTVLITGAAGFIGSCLTRQLIDETDWNVIAFDALTYAGHLGSLAAVADHPRFSFVRGDLADRALLARLIAERQPDAISHLAAESHVDRSIHSPEAFIRTNVHGTFNLLEAARDYLSGLAPERRQRFRFHHISTDEVFGSLGAEGAFSERTPYAPNSPYSASKAGSDHLVRAWHHTYGLPVVTTNCSNNYGPHQFPEKLIPLMILNALGGKSLPIYGRGQNVRDWLFVDDHCRALRQVLESGRVGEVYCVGGRAERSNIEVVKQICSILDELRPKPAPYSEQIRFVEDRPGHDQRYAIDCSKIEQELGWSPRASFESGLRSTVQWYLDNGAWVEAISSGEYRQWLDLNYRGRAA